MCLAFNVTKTFSQPFLASKIDCHFTFAWSLCFFFFLFSFYSPPVMFLWMPQSLGHLLTEKRITHRPNHAKHWTLQFWIVNQGPCKMRTYICFLFALISFFRQMGFSSFPLWYSKRCVCVCVCCTCTAPRIKDICCWPYGCLYDYDCSCSYSAKHFLTFYLNECDLACDSKNVA